MVLNLVSLADTLRQRQSLSVLTVNRNFQMKFIEFLILLIFRSRHKTLMTSG
jgi:hypothetical protein